MEFFNLDIRPREHKQVKYLFFKGTGVSKGLLAIGEISRVVKFK